MRLLPLAAALSATFALPALAETEVKPLFETEPNAVIDSLDRLLSVFGAEEEYDESKGLNSSYIPAVFYTPEQGLGVGLLYVGLYGDTQGGTEQPSALILNPYVSSNGSMGISGDSYHFTNGGDNRFNLDFKIQDDASVYYGVGYQNGQQDDNQVDYAERLLRLKPSWQSRVGGNLFLGAGADLQIVAPTDIEPSTGAEGLAGELERNTSYGGFVSAVYDSRDNVISASEGMLLQADIGAYYDDSNSEAFGLYDLTASQYLSLDPVPGLLAWQVQGSFSSGEVPWNRLPDLGGDKAMRGYIEGRYRDNQMMMAQMEYRLPIYWRIGMVFWGAAGTVADTPSELWEDTLYSYGTGFRVKIKDKVNLRADIGFGEHEAAFYFHVNEVF
ncbi:BamA/TamA family outer membrane protein [Ferrimonas marina]|uniref:Surface antigen n=1 Tax=Ferrimonas marina TaxID=299255 RepID=A0A1M5P787_9GAMM|nr:hypothetical protein [Ferrimonas marina]SHG97547.1 hypothetical protein SAMN02745129_1312 [Ferrimonas marina]